jgi:heme exporter protein A
LLRLVAGLVEFQEGTLSWTDAAGQSLEPEEARALYHYVGHLDAVKPSFTVGESLKFWADLYGAGAPIDEALERLEIGFLRDVPGQFLSAGQRRRASLARLLVSKRSLWILDEPTNSLDKEGVALVRTLMGEHCTQGGALMVTTHVELGLEQVDRLELPRLEGAA